MAGGVVLCAFGEPAEPDREAVVAYLERIFRQNAQLESPASEAEAAERARQLAERRAPGLLEEYESIGGSPLNAQATGHATALETILQDRGYDVGAYVGFQFTEPFVEDAVDAARADGVERLVGLPLYPLCGPSTTVAALERLGTAAGTGDEPLSLKAVSGWHRHPDYVVLRADNVASFARTRGVDLDDPATAFVCSAHGTPISYLEAGSRYREYVEEHAAALTDRLDLDGHVLGYQNHEHRDIPWTEPAVEDAIASLDADRLVVEPISFLHEQSETLMELDEELREEAEALGLEFHRVPIPHDDPRVAELLADLAESLLGDGEPIESELRACRCVDRPGTVCLNAPPSGAR